MIDKIAYRTAQKVAAVVARHRNNRLLALLDVMAVKYHHAYENYSYEHSTNGEARVLDRMSRVCKVETVFDIGANIGEWTLEAAKHFSNAKIHAFEIVPATYKELAKNVSHLKNCSAHGVGLSDEQGAVDVFYSPDWDYAASCVQGISELFDRSKVQRISAKVTTGDHYCAEAGINAIDFLKLDVEGFENKVLSGFEGMLKAQKIKVIQFEYGYVNATVHFLLKDFYNLLGDYGMKIGKIYPGFVEFRDYKFKHEDLVGANYLAVHPSSPEVIRAMAEG